MLQYRKMSFLKVYQLLLSSIVGKPFLLLSYPREDIPLCQSTAKLSLERWLTAAISLNDEIDIVSREIS